MGSKIHLDRRTKKFAIYLLEDGMLHHPHLEELGVRLHPRGGAALTPVLRVGVLGRVVLQVVVEHRTAGSQFDGVVNFHSSHLPTIQHYSGGMATKTWSKVDTKCNSRKLSVRVSAKDRSLGCVKRAPAARGQDAGITQPRDQSLRFLE